MIENLTQLKSDSVLIRFCNLSGRLANSIFVKEC